MSRGSLLAVAAAALTAAIATPTADARQRHRPRTFPFSPPKALRSVKHNDALPSLWSDGRACSRGCRARGAVRGWPVRPFHRPHLLRAGLNELRPGNLHTGVDILARDGTRVYAMQPGFVRVLETRGPDARVQVGNFVYWHVRARFSLIRYVRPYRDVVGTVLRGAGHVHISEVVGERYVNPLRPGGRLLFPWRDRIRPVLSRPRFGRRGQVSIKGFDPVARRRARPVLGLAGLAYRLFDRRGHRVGPLRWAYRGSQHLPNRLRGLVYVRGSRPAYAKCVMRRHRPCRPRWVYRLAGGLAPRLPSRWRRRYRLTAYAWDWSGNTVAIDSPRRSKAHGAQAGGKLSAPRQVASGVRIPLRGTGFPAAQRVTVEHRRHGRWRKVLVATTDEGGRFRARFRPKRAKRRYTLRARVGAAASRPVTVRSRAVLLAAVGDINLGDGVAGVMARRGYRFPWSGVAPVLRDADLAFGNLECSVSNRGSPVPKEFNFRGRPAALRVAHRYAGLDAVNLANNHVGDYGIGALGDTVSFVRRFGMQPVGAGRNAADARRPRVLKRLGLRVAFVGFSDILPRGFEAGLHRPGDVFASPRAVRHGVRTAKRRADVVVASFHWGVERHTRETGRQRALAHTALKAGAKLVIGGHPHVLQPIRRHGRRLVAYGMGNFVWSASGGVTGRTGILKVRLSTKGVEGAHLLRAAIEGSRPRLLR